MGCEWTANGQHHGCEHRGCEAHGRSGRRGCDRTADRSPLAQPVLLVDEVGQAANMGQAARHSMAHCFREAPVTHEGGSIDGVQLHQDGPERVDGRDLGEGAVERPAPLEAVEGVAHGKFLFELPVGLRLV